MSKIEFHDVYVPILLMALLSTALPGSAQQVDPTLTATVAAQTITLNDIHSKRRKLQESIIATEATVTLALDRVHKVEDKMLDYLTNISGAMQNLYQVKRAAELVANDIPSNIKALTKAIPGNLQGTAISAIVSNEVKDIYLQMEELLPFMYQLVTSGTYNVTNAEGENEKHKVNLLNSAERYYIADNVVHRLEMINVDLRILTYQVKTMTWTDLWRGLDPQSWIQLRSGKVLASSLIHDWNAL